MIIPVYNRPGEIDELLHSFTRQESGNFEIIVVEDGSIDRCDGIVEKYSNRLNIRYFFKPNSGPGPSRNYGAERSKGDFLLFLDSDCTVPAGWLNKVGMALDREDVDAFGGPDRADDSFSTTQKAINYSMTSFLTTGGMRGRKTRVCRFYPRSFNMGIRREVFERLGGFSDMRYGEDLDLSYRLVDGGFTTALFHTAWVYHKRRTCLWQFSRQIFNSGCARVVLSKKHKGTLKPVHILPALFTVGVVGLLAFSVWQPWLLLALALFSGIILVDATVRTKCLVVGSYAVAASFIQLVGYGTGCIKQLVYD